MRDLLFDLIGAKSVLKKLAVKLRADKLWDFIFRARFILPARPQLTFLPGQPVTPEDVAVCRRLIVAYQKSAGSFSTAEMSGVWSGIIQRHHGPLVKAVENSAPRVLALLLSEMFQQGFMTGVASGDNWKSRRFGSELILAAFMENSVHLAEYLGAVRAESATQGVIGFALKDGLIPLLSRIEAACGRSMAFPLVGAPYGVQVGGSVVTLESLEHFYIALRIHRAIGERRGLNVVEIGAGFGGLPYWLSQNGEAAFKNYTIIDLPIMNVLQGYFLSKALGADSVSLFGEEVKKYAVMPTHHIGRLSDVDLLINTDSMPEIPEQIVLDYLAWAKAGIRGGGMFYSYNHEAYTTVTRLPQTLVSEMVARVGGFKRRSRELSWMGNRYVEEIYEREP